MNMLMNNILSVVARKESAGDSAASGDNRDVDIVGNCADGGYRYIASCTQVQLGENISTREGKRSHSS